MAVGKGAAATLRTKPRTHRDFYSWEGRSSNYQTDEFVWGLYLPEWHLLNFSWNKEADICHLATICCQSQRYRASVIQKIQAAVSLFHLFIYLFIYFFNISPDVFWWRDQDIISTHRALILLSLTYLYTSRDIKFQKALGRTWQGWRWELGFRKMRLCISLLMLGLQEQTG